MGRVALVHDLLDQDGGAERVLWALHMMFPEAPIFTAMWGQRRAPRFATCDVRTSWMQRLPGIARFPRAFAPLYPLAFAQLRLERFDTIISSSSYFAKGVHKGRAAVHIAYCHSPSNFIWRSRAYTSQPIPRLLTASLRSWLKAWDRWAARQPDALVANSQTVADRIRRFYHREATIVPPPIDRRWFVEHQSDDFYLVVCRLVSHKRVDLAIRACEHLGMPLVVAGEGRAIASLKRIAGPMTEFLGRPNDAELGQLYARARAVIVPAEEDFGLVPLEAQAAGTPVIAFDAGGARETVVDGVTGIRFAPQTVEALARAITQSAQCSWDRDLIQAHAARFSQDRFVGMLTDVIATCKAHGMELEVAPVFARRSSQ